jgi:Arc/MetJ family transcription regulator
VSQNSPAVAPTVRRDPTGYIGWLKPVLNRTGHLTTAASDSTHPAEERVIFKAVRDGRPYPDHDLSLREWSRVTPRQVRLDELITTKRVLALDVLLDDDSTFYGDLFPHVVLWQGELYLEDGLHRALRAALQHSSTLPARVLDLDNPEDNPEDSSRGGADVVDAGVSGARP